MPGDDDIRAPVRRADLGGHPRPRGRGRHRLPGQLRRLPAGRGPDHPRRHRGHPRPLAQGQARPLHRGHQVLRPDRAGAVRPRQLPQAHHVRRRRLAAAAADRLHRPVPAARLRPEHADRREPGRPRRPRPPGQGPLHRLLQLPHLPAGAGRRPQRDARDHPVRLGPAPVQPAVPPDRAGDAAVLRRGGRRGHPLQPDRRRPAVGQAHPLRAAPGRHPLHPRHGRRGTTRTATGTSASSTPSRPSARSPTRPA